MSRCGSDFGRITEPGFYPETDIRKIELLPEDSAPVSNSESTPSLTGEEIFVRNTRVRNLVFWFMRLEQRPLPLTLFPSRKTLDHLYRRIN
jgi:hypothetical protein